MKTKAMLATADIWLKKPMACTDIIQAVQLVLDLDYTVVSGGRHFFKPDSIGAFWILSDSQCSVRTYPDDNYFTIDLFTQGDDAAPIDTLYKLVKQMPFNSMDINQHQRGVL